MKIFSDVKILPILKFLKNKEAKKINIKKYEKIINPSSIKKYDQQGKLMSREEQKEDLAERVRRQLM